MTFRFVPAFLLIFGLTACAFAEEVIVHGTAVIRGGDLGEAREQASRRALAQAAEFREARVSSHALVQSGVASETVQVRASACTGPVDLLGEKVSGNELTVSLRVMLGDSSQCRQMCATAYTNRLVTTAFALEYPEQKLPTEHARVSALTAIELAKKITRRGRLLAAYAAGVYPYVAPSRAPVVRSAPDEIEPLLVALARQYRGQYIVSGVYRDLGVFRPAHGGGRKRVIQVEAFLHDGANGEVIFNQMFTREVRGDVELPGAQSIGSAAFYDTDFGLVWGSVLESIAAWGEEKAACLPFIARVLKVNGKSIQIDAGAEAGLSVGDTLSLHSWRDPPIFGVDGNPLGREKFSRTRAVVRVVYPRFSLIELQDVSKSLEVKAGDVLYAQ